MREAKAGVLQVNSDFGPGEFEALRQAAEISQRPLSALIIQVDHEPDLWRQTLRQIGKANEEGLTATGQVGCRPIGVLLGLEATVNHSVITLPIRRLLSFLSMNVVLLRNDRELRSVEERPQDAFSEWMDYALTRAFELGPELNYEPEPDTWSRLVPLNWV